MKIVASNSLTVSNVNDGTITHTAWSYSADGTDRFTTVYPNLNLLEGSKKYTKDNPKTVSSSDTNGVFYVNDVFVKNLKAGTYTMSGKADAPWTVHETSGVNRQGKVGLWLLSTTPGLNVKISLDDTVPKTIKVPKDGDYCVRVNTYSNGTNIETHKFWEFKLEQGSIATPYMQSASEVTTADWPKYIGHYTDFMQTDSTNPSDYTWGPMRGDDGALDEEQVKEITDKIDTKADQALTQEQINALNENNQILEAEMQAKASMEAFSDLEKNYQSFVKANEDGQAKAEADLIEAGRRIELLTTQFGGLAELKTFIDTYMSSSNEGLIIGKNDASSTIKVSSDRISMFSAGEEVMYISQGVININNGIFATSVQIGKFRTEQYHLNADMNVIRYVGE